METGRAVVLPKSFFEFKWKLDRATHRTVNKDTGGAESNALCRPPWLARTSKQSNSLSFGARVVFLDPRHFAACLCEKSEIRRERKVGSTT